MTTAHNSVDISDEPALIRLVEEVRASGEPVRLVRDDEELAVITPIRAAEPTTRRRRTIRHDDAAVLEAAGGWAGNVDTEQLKADIKAARGSRRRPVTL